MPAPVRLRTDFSATELRRLAKRAKHTNQSRRLLSLAAVLDGKSRVEADTIGGMDRPTLRDWVHHFNAAGPEGLKDNLVLWSDAAPISRAKRRTRADRRDRPRSREGWRRALAAR